MWMDGQTTKNVSPDDGCTDATVTNRALRPSNHPRRLKRHVLSNGAQHRSSEQHCDIAPTDGTARIDENFKDRQMLLLLLLSAATSSSAPGVPTTLRGRPVTCGTTTTGAFPLAG